MKKLLVLFAVAVLSCALPSANAHSELVSSNPSASTYIEELPEQIELEFNEELLNLGSGNSVSIMSPSGEDLGMGETSTDGARVTRLLNTTSELGSFEVKYRVASADGHILNGSFTFNLIEAAVVTSENEKTTESESGSNLLVNSIIGIIAFGALLLIELARRSRKRRITSAD
jgi:methionine-rich copper-binding protein CopC